MMGREGPAGWGGVMGVGDCGSNCVLGLLGILLMVLIVFLVAGRTTSSIASRVRVYIYKTRAVG